MIWPVILSIVNILQMRIKMEMCIMVILQRVKAYSCMTLP